MVSSEGLLWYIFPIELLVGLFLANFFSPTKKAQDDRWEVVGCVIFFVVAGKFYYDRKKKF